MNEQNKFIAVAPLAILLAIASGCSDRTVTDEVAKANTLFNDTWDSGCHENPRPVDDPNSPVGYFRETLLIDGTSATQTIEYFDDANCSVPVTSQQVVDQNDDTFFLIIQSQDLAVSYPVGTTLTELGEAQHIDLQVESVAINNITLTETELQDAGIELSRMLGIIIVTQSDRLHLGSTTSDLRPATVPLDFSYERLAE